MGDDSHPDYAFFVLEGYAGGTLIVAAVLESGQGGHRFRELPRRAIRDESCGRALLGSLQRWGWFDYDFDGGEGLLNIYGVDASVAYDPASGETLDKDSLVPVTVFAYHDPDARPDYSFSFTTLGVGYEFHKDVENVVLSFQPPGA